MSGRRLVVGAAILRHGCVLTARRTSPAEAAGRWEFPGGKVEPGETPGAALVREIAEELGCTIEVIGWLPGTVPIGDRYDLVVATARLVRGDPSPTEHDAVRWLTPETVDDVDWLDSDRPFLPQVRERLLEGEPLAGGNVGGAVRVGDTVRRPTGPWSPAVHALLTHLADAGLRCVPRFRGTDERGREALDFLPGEVIDVDTDLLTEARLGALASWTRELHEAVRDFHHDGPWRGQRYAEDADLIGHNDLAPYNVAFDGDELVGVFDWDMAGPTTAGMELAHQAWNAVPLFRDVGAELSARRLQVMAGAYGGVTGAEVLDLVVARIRANNDTVRAMVSDGDPGGAGLLAAGEPERTERALDALIARLPRIRAMLTR